MGQFPIDLLAVFDGKAAIAASSLSRRCMGARRLEMAVAGIYLVAVGSPVAGKAQTD